MASLYASWRTALELLERDLPAEEQRVGAQELQSGGHSDDVARLPWAHLRLPPFPQVALRVLQLANNDNVPLHQLCDLISTDPAFASEVLTVANSILYAPRYPSTSILQAVTVLGANTLQGMCMTVGVRAYLGKTMHLPAMRAVWRHNLACALIAERLAELGFVDKDTAYTAGILHDMGRIALAVVEPAEYAELLGVHFGPPAGILQDERALFGLDHCETGLQLVDEWKLPADFYQVVFDHHSPRLKDGSWTLAELIKVSCRMADTCGFPAFAGCEAEPYAKLLSELPARERRLFFADGLELATEVGDHIRAIEAA